MVSKKITLRLITLVAMTAIVLTTPTITVGAAMVEPPGQEYGHDGLNVLLLGDSFSAGNGARGYGGYRWLDGCYRASNNWSEQYVRWLKGQGHSVVLHNRACSGAITKDIINARDWKRTSKNTSLLLPFSKVGLDKGLAKKEVESRRLCSPPMHSELFLREIRINDVRRWGADDKTMVDYSCLHSLPAQSDWIGPEVDVVLLTIGGNDLGFSNILATCVLPVTNYGYIFKLACPSQLKSAYDAMPNIKANIIKALEKIRQSGLRSDAKIILLGYPLMSLDNGNLLGGIAIANHIRQIGKDLNTMQSEAVREFNQRHPGQAYFVNNVQSHFAWHEPNTNIFLPNPKRWIHNIFEPGLDFYEWFHPNEQGHREYANLLKRLSMDGVIKTIKATGPSVDIVFNIDTTTSMSSELAHMKNTIRQAADRLKAQTSNVRFAVTSFRNHPEITKNNNDYSALANLHFTQDINELVRSIDGLIAGGTGGEGKKSVWSGLMSGLNMKWRPGVEKVVVTITNNSPYAQEPVTDYTKKVVADKAFRVDPAQMYFILTSSDEALVGEYETIAFSSGGDVLIAEPDGFTGLINDVVDVVARKPHAWLDGPLAAKFGDEVVFDASGSYSGFSDIIKYEWDFEADG